MQKTRGFLMEKGLDWETTLEEKKLFEHLYLGIKMIEQMEQWEEQKVVREHKRLILKQFSSYMGNIKVIDANVFFSWFGNSNVVYNEVEEKIIGLFSLKFYEEIGEVKLKMELKKPSDEKIEKYLASEENTMESGEYLVQGYRLKKIFSEKETGYELGYKIKEFFEEKQKHLTKNEVTNKMEDDIISLIKEDFYFWDRKRKEEVWKKEIRKKKAEIK